MLDTFATPNIETPAAFNRLRRDLHNAAGSNRVAANRTRSAIADLRERAALFRQSMEIWAGQPLGDWYATLAVRLEEAAEELEIDATRAGLLGGE